MKDNKQYILKEENIHKGYLILVNPTNLLEKQEMELVSFSDDFSDMKLEKKALEHLKEALEHIQSGDRIVPVSGYRSLQEQIDIYESSLEENGEEFTKKFVALPNASEHQSGLAIDLALNEGDIDFICPSFPYHGICNEFRKCMGDYGFIERYKEEKKNITKISKEEWHFRYIGFPHSKIMEDLEYCLEEYIEYLKEFTYPNHPLIKYGRKIYYVPFTKEGEILEIPSISEVSGNNADGFILTIKEEC